MDNVYDSITVSIPSGLDDMVLPDPEKLDYYKGLEDRELWITNEIDTDTLDIARKIMQWNKEDKDFDPNDRIPIKIFFFSNGGDLDINNTLTNLVSISHTPIWGINMGRCMSAAAFIFLACHKRFMLPDAYFLFHQGSGAFSGTFGEVAAQMEDYAEQVKNLSTYMIDHTNYTEEEVSANIGGEWYVRSKEALEKGVCDEILTDLSVLYESN